jgi:hypothetical protein
MAACANCPAGFYCSGPGTHTPISCPKGSYCPESSASHSPCAAGKYQNLDNATQPGDCQDCPPGKYCLGGKQTNDGNCDAGYYCASASDSKTKTKCVAGTVCPEGSSQEKDCPQGKYCSMGASVVNAPADCDAGYVCMGKATTATPTDGVLGKECDAGYYCHQGVGYQFPCKAGRLYVYGPNKGAVDDTVCT